MSRKRKPPRLYLRKRKGCQPWWVIKDGSGETSTGCSEHDLAGAEKALERYLTEKHIPQKTGISDPAQILIADIVNTYAQEHVPTLVRSDVAIYCLENILKWWGDKTLADVKGQSCRDYATWRSRQGVGQTTVRHDLVALRGAIGYYDQEYGLPVVPVMVMPPQTPPRERWLTRDEVARFLWAAWHRKDFHVVRFILLGVYTGTRSKAIKQMRWTPSTEGGWIDLQNGVFHRRAQGAKISKKRQPPARIPPRLLPHLRRWHAQDRAAGLSHVIHYKGAPMLEMRKTWHGARKAAGLDKSVTPHVLRHTAATWLMQSGAEKWDICGYLGMTMEVLESTYGHHHPDHQQSAVEAFSRGGRT